MVDPNVTVAGNFGAATEKCVKHYRCTYAKRAGELVFGLNCSHYGRAITRDAAFLGDSVCITPAQLLFDSDLEPRQKYLQLQMQTGSVHAGSTHMEPVFFRSLF